jgi:signal transduction histidine kinase
VDEIIENVRRLSRDLSPSILEDLGLSAALQWLVDDASQHYDIGAYVEMDDIRGLFSQEAQIIVYRIIQESLANIGKHANASQVSLVVKKTNGRMSFTIEDDGSGFDLEHIQSLEPTQKGLGLAAMDERVRMLKGDLDIWSKEGRGTKITFVVPVKDE